MFIIDAPQLICWLRHGGPRGARSRNRSYITRALSHKVATPPQPNSTRTFSQRRDSLPYSTLEFGLVFLGIHTIAYHSEHSPSPGINWLILEIGVWDHDVISRSQCLEKVSLSRMTKHGNTPENCLDRILSTGSTKILKHSENLSMTCLMLFQPRGVYSIYSHYSSV